MQLFKFPTVQDYHNGLKELDATHSISIKRWLLDLETTYIVLQDTIYKNFDRLFEVQSEIAASSTI